MRPALIALALAAWLTPARADEIRLPGPVLARDAVVTGTWRLDPPAAGKASLRIVWTDALGRVVDRIAVAGEADAAGEIPFALDLRRAVAMRNELAGEVEVAGTRRQATQRFIARPFDPTWWDYQIIMWHPRDAAQNAALKALGITAGMVMPDRLDPGSAVEQARIEPLLSADLRWYLENIATDFYAPYHRWSPDRPVNWLFTEAQRRHREDPASLAPFHREPSLSDPAWLARVTARLGAAVERYRPYAPLYYSLADEPGIGDLAAHWDFDFSPPSLQAMRDWLKTRYPSLAALNASWGASFAAWDEVVPMTTAEALRRTDGNHAAWAEFKMWMDEAFARAVEAGSAAVHAADPQALAAIEGAQIPGWGGYDYNRLARAADVVDLYHYGGNVEILRARNPGGIMLHVGWGNGAAQWQHAWRHVLRGARGMILWDPDSRYVDAQGRATATGRQAAPEFAALRGGVPALLAASPRETDPIAILYSPASERTRWLLDRRAEGGTGWAERSAETEYEPTALREARLGAMRLLERAGLSYGFVAPAELADGALERRGIRLLLLPHAIAMAAAEADGVRRFVAGGGTALADEVPGAFDELSRARQAPLLADLFGDAATSSSRAGRAMRFRAALPAEPAPRRAAIRAMQAIAAQAGIRPDFTLHDADGEVASEVESFLFRNGGLALLALHETKPTSDANARDGKAGDAKPREIRVELAADRFVQDLWSGQPLGHGRSFALTLDPARPAILALSAAPLPALRLAAPQEARAGEAVTLSLELASPGPAEVSIFHVEVRNPAGNAVPHYSGNLRAWGGKATRALTFALNDAPGSWTIRARDAASGHSAEHRLLLRP